jgi:hypothetical protein
MAEEAKERRIKALYRRVLSQRYPQIYDAGIEANTAMEVMMPNATRGPPKTLVSLNATK